MARMATDNAIAQMMVAVRMTVRVDGRQKRAKTNRREKYSNPIRTDVLKLQDW